MGRISSGVKGIELEGATVVGAEVVNSGQYILIVTEKGYGKKTVIDEYRLTHRGSKGVRAFNVTEKNGMMAALKCVDEGNDYDVIVVTNSGIIMKMPGEQISTLKRATQGVRLINLKDDQMVSTVAIVAKDEENNENSDSGNEDVTSNSENLNSLE